MAHAIYNAEETSKKQHLIDEQLASEQLAAAASSLFYTSDQYEQWLQKEARLASGWQTLFELYQESQDKQTGAAEGKQTHASTEAETHTHTPFHSALEGVRVYHLIERYRSYGHLMAQINPIATSCQLQLPWQLSLQSAGFGPHELDRLLPTAGFLKQERATLKEIVEALQKTYCGKIGVEYWGLQNPELEQWLQQRVEQNFFEVQLSIEQKKAILQNLNKAELFENFLHTKYTGQKRFSLEGCETLIPMLSAIIEEGASMGILDFVIGMAHRGRLNVLSNILNKSYSSIFSEFSEDHLADSFEGSGDVKYHKGFYSDVTTSSGKQVRVDLSPNPSHLEAVNSVVLGIARAKQLKLTGSLNGLGSVIPILIHGDAAVAGQGVVYETMQLSQLKGYTTGGTLHIIINNQIGFTTSPRDARSTRYCSDIARAFGAPVFHVNAEEPASCVYATLIAVELRQRFGCDVFIDLNGWRKYGHNESDEPAFTQPLEYELIRKKKKIRESYRDDLIHQGIVEKQIAESLEAQFIESLQKALDSNLLEQQKKGQQPSEMNGNADLSKESAQCQDKPTALSKEKLQEIAFALTAVPPDLQIHRKIEALLKERRLMVDEDPSKRRAIDWGMAESMAFGSLLLEGYHVRLSGQDSQRGTFSQRHAVLFDQANGRGYCPLKHLSSEQGLFEVINSPLSEYAVLGFEYGYSLAYSGALVLWEAQFGDFSNGAQVIIDQFIASAQQKWAQRNSVVLLLPHGYEGQGPEHSSARMERFLALSGNGNWRVVYPSEPAQLFHLLRGHLLNGYDKPLILFTPKAMLRHPMCTNDLSSLTKGRFQTIIDDHKANAGKVKTVVFCTGKIYFELDYERTQRAKDDLALIRIEQLYPLEEELLKQIIDRYTAASTFIFAQEEPSNMGAWDFIHPHLRRLLPAPSTLEYAGRQRSSSPATGVISRHKKEHRQIISTIFDR